jgi:hypothetical protein
LKHVVLVGMLVAERGYSKNVHRLLVSPLQGPQTAQMALRAPREGFVTLCLH